MYCNTTLDIGLPYIVFYGQSATQSVKKKERILLLHQSEVLTAVAGEKRSKVMFVSSFQLRRCRTLFSDVMSRLVT